MLYPRDSQKRGAARILPSFASQLFMAESFATDQTRVVAIATPAGVNQDHFAAYAFYVQDRLTKLAILNMNPYYANSTEDFTMSVDVAAHVAAARGHKPSFGPQAYVKRLTAPHIDEGNSSVVTWAGQEFSQGVAQRTLDVEHVGRDGIVRVRGSEALLVFFDQEDMI